MRTAVYLLALVCAAAALSSVVPQKAPPAQYVQRFGLAGAEWVQRLGLDAIYGAWWFVGLLAFLALSVMLCVARNTPRLARQFGQHARSAPPVISLAQLRAMPLHVGVVVAQHPAAIARQVQAALQAKGWRVSVQQQAEKAQEKTGQKTGQKTQQQATQQTDPKTAQATAQSTTQVTAQAALQAPHPLALQQEQAWAVAARKAGWARLGYFATHSAVVLICAGALADSDWWLRMRMWQQGKSPIAHDEGLAAMATPVQAVAPMHRLDAQTLAYRGHVWALPGQPVQQAVLEVPGGYMLQALPVAITLQRFEVDYYPDGSPRSYASELLLRDAASGRTSAHRLQVNQPVHAGGVRILQTGFDDGGSTVTLRVRQLQPQASGAPEYLTGVIGQRLAWLHALPHGLPRALPYAAQHANQSAPGAMQAQAANQPLEAIELLELQPHDVRAGQDWGPYVRYRLRDAAGQGVELRHHLRARDMGDGLPVYLLALRPDVNTAIASSDAANVAGQANAAGEAAPFLQLRIPQDAQGRADDFWRLHQALGDSAARQAAVARYVATVLDADAPAQQRALLQQTGEHVLALFAGQAGAPTADKGASQAVNHATNSVANPATRQEIDHAAGNAAKAVEKPTEKTTNTAAAAPPQAASARADKSTEKPTEKATAMAADQNAQADARPAASGLQALARLAQAQTPPQQQAHALEVMLRMLTGVLLELLQHSRAQAGLPALDGQSPATQAFMRRAVASLSDAQLLDVPLALEMQDFELRHASVLQVVREPGRPWVYAGGAWLVVGVFLMLYARERRLWLWIAPAPAFAHESAPASAAAGAHTYAHAHVPVSHCWLALADKRLDATQALSPRQVRAQLEDWLDLLLPVHSAAGPGAAPLSKQSQKEGWEGQQGERGQS